MIGLTSSLAMWYFTRGSGAVALVLLTCSFALGAPTLLSWGNDRLPRLVVQLLHRNVSLLVTVFIFLHVATTVIDGFAPIGWLDVVIPFRAGYRPIWLGLGAVAVDLLLAVIITSLLRVRMGYDSWRRVHYLTYAMWPIALVHALGTGTDTKAPFMWWIDWGCAAVVVAFTAVRLVARPPVDPRWRNAAFGVLVLTPLLVLVWTIKGPMTQTWGKKARPAVTTTTVAGDAPAAAQPALTTGGDTP